VSDGSVLVCYLHPATEIQHSFSVSLMGLVNHDAANRRRLFTSTGPLMMRCGTGGLVDARNKAVRHFLDESSEEWLWFVDTDMGFQPDTVDRLVEAADPVERPVMGGLCFGMKQGDSDGFGGYLTAPFPTIYGWHQGPDGNAGFKGATGYPRDAVVKVAATGAACLLIHRTAAEKVRAEHGDTWFDQVRYPSGALVSEDLSFCYRLGMLGIPVHVHTGVRTTHAKTVWVGEREFLAHRALEEIAAEAAKVEAVADAAS
jgi:GT2 family glycosyltransferase